MTFDDFMNKMLDAFPDAVVEEDNYGQLIIYTDLMEGPDNTVVPFVEPDDEQEEKSEAE